MNIINYICLTYLALVAVLLLYVGVRQGIHAFLAYRDLKKLIGRVRW